MDVLRYSRRDMLNLNSKAQTATNEVQNLSKGVLVIAISCMTGTIHPERNMPVTVVQHRNLKDLLESGPLCPWHIVYWHRRGPEIPAAKLYINILVIAHTMRDVLLHNHVSSHTAHAWCKKASLQMPGTLTKRATMQQPCVFYLCVYWLKLLSESKGRLDSCIEMLHGTCTGVLFWIFKKTHHASRSINLSKYLAGVNHSA